MYSEILARVSYSNLIKSWCISLKIRFRALFTEARVNIALVQTKMANGRLRKQLSFYDFFMYFRQTAAMDVGAGLPRREYLTICMQMDLVAVSLSVARVGRGLPSLFFESALVPAAKNYRSSSNAIFSHICMDSGESFRMTSSFTSNLNVP